MSVTSSAPVRKLYISQNVIFSAHAISQQRRHSTSGTFRKGHAMYIRYQIWNVASAQEWNFTAEMLWCFCGFAQLRTLEGTLVTRESARFDNNDSEPKSEVTLHKFPEEN